MATSHFNLPEFAETGTADLLGIYNKAVESIDSQLYSAYQEAIAASAAASKAQSTADTGNATANGAVAVNNKQNTDISSLQATIENLQIFNPTSAQLAAMNSGVNVNYTKRYTAWLSDAFPNRTQGQFTIVRSGNVCIAGASNICVSQDIAPNTVIPNVIPKGFLPNSYYTGVNGMTIRMDGGIRTGSAKLTASSWWRDFVVYLTDDDFPSDSYVKR